MNVIFTSGGNDSVALTQWAIEHEIPDLVAAYCDTGWAAPWWEQRISQFSNFCFTSGVRFVRIKSEGMEAMVRRKKGFPAGGRMAQFCTSELKIKPGIEWLEEADPEQEARVLTGVRRQESRERSDAPEFVEESDRHGGRELWQPLVRVEEPERDALIIRAGFKVLPHRSMECSPCINANIDDLRALDEESIERLALIEDSMGHTGKGKPRVMFRPARHKGAVGIREVVKWAKSPRRRDQIDLMQCTSGWCGD